MNQLGENLGAFSDSSLKTFATALGLDQGEFDACLDSNRYRNVVNGDVGEGGERGVTSTPTLIVNGQIIPGITSFDDLQPIIEAELSRR